MTREEIRQKIQALDELPTVPAIVQPLAQMLQQPSEQVDLDKVLGLVSQDSTIAAQCLRMANSPLFGRRNTETVRAAVLALGLKRVQSILMSCSLNRMVPSDRWSLEPVTFWRHSLGCALVSSRLAKLIGYPDPGKAHLAGLLHDLGIVVNTVAFTKQFRQCVEKASAEHAALDCIEQQCLGFTHCESGKILAEQWKFSDDIIAVVEFHHDAEKATTARSLVALVHLSDLLCRLRDLGYGYYEAMGVDLAQDRAWTTLAGEFPALANMDVVRLSLDIEGAMEEITSLVDAVFKPVAAVSA